MRNGFGVRSDILMTQLQCCSVKKKRKKTELYLLGRLHGAVNPQAGDFLWH